MNSQYFSRIYFSRYFYSSFKSTLKARIKITRKINSRKILAIHFFLVVKNKLKKNSKIHTSRSAKKKLGRRKVK